jgi:hypothetical protein
MRIAKWHKAEKKQIIEWKNCYFYVNIREVNDDGRNFLAS